MELYALIIHGILHLCGYDHVTDADEAVMNQLQEKIIKEIYSNES
jgi:rRNA maturation RNase YbeY